MYFDSNIQAQELSRGTVSHSKREVEQIDVSQGRQEHIAAFFNECMPNLSPKERLALALEVFPEGAFMTSSGGIQSGVLPALLSSLRAETTDKQLAKTIEQLPIVLLDTGDLFPEALEYVRQMQRRLRLNFKRFSHGLSQAVFRSEFQQLTETGHSLEDAFDELSKVRPMRALLEQFEVKVWLSGNRREQSRSRAKLPFAEVKNGYVKVYPLVDLDDSALQVLKAELDVIEHPLSGTYRSLGNQSDTRPASASDVYEKDARHNGVKEECGLHLDWGTETTAVPLRELEL